MVIVDASVISKLFLPLEKYHYEAKAVLKKHLQKLEEINVPDLLFYEVANALVTKSTIPISTVLKDLKRLDKFNLNIHHFSVVNLSAAAKFARTKKVSVYDAAYAVLAQEKKCNLITADEKFAKQVNLPFVKTLEGV